MADMSFATYTKIEGLEKMVFQLLDAVAQIQQQLAGGGSGAGTGASAAKGPKKTAVKGSNRPTFFRRRFAENQANIDKVIASSALLHDKTRQQIDTVKELKTEFANLMKTEADRALNELNKDNSSAAAVAFEAEFKAYQAQVAQDKAAPPLKSGATIGSGPSSSAASRLAAHPQWSQPTAAAPAAAPRARAAIAPRVPAQAPVTAVTPLAARLAAASAAAAASSSSSSAAPVGVRAAGRGGLAARTTFTPSVPGRRTALAAAPAAAASQEHVDIDADADVDNGADEAVDGAGSGAEYADAQ